MNSIRFRLLLVLLAVGLVPMLVVTFVTNRLTASVLERSEHEKIGAVTHEVTRQVRRLMGAAASDLVALRGNRLITGAHTPMDERVDEMERLVMAYQMFDDITLYDSQGLMVRSTTDENHPEPIEKTEWFKLALKDGTVVTSRPHRVIGHEGLHLKVYIPIAIAGTNEDFILRARLRFKPVWDLIDEVQIGDKGEAMILDPRGTVIAGQNKERILMPFTDGKTAPFWLDGRGMVEIDGEDYYFRSDVLSREETRTNEAWVIACLRPRAELIGSVEDAVAVQTVIAMGALLAVGLLGVFTARRFTAPVVQASRAAQRVSAGDLDTRVPEMGASEVRQLARSFNSMVDEVRDHRYQLEALVESRTRKLQQSQAELENIHAQLRAAYEAAREGILVIGTDGELIAANQLVIDYFGLEGDLDTMTIADFQEQAGRCFANGESFGEVWSSINADPDHLADGEWELVAPQERSLSVYSAPVCNSSGGQIARLWTFQDVTNQRMLQKSLEQAQKMEAVGRLAGGVAHDFNNLLTGIIGNLSLVELSNERTGADEAQFIRSAKRAGQRAAELVKKLLGFSRQSHLELTYCQANEVLAEIEGLLSATLDPKIALELERADDLWTVEADATQIEQVVMNMVVNSRDAIGDRGGRISLATRNLTIGAKAQARSHPLGSAGDYVVITVEDDGTGIPESVQSKIFEPFFTTKEQGKGTGLGLATSYGIVHQHGGWIECDSEPGRGTTFSIYLPRKDRPTRAKALRKAQGDVSGGDETILLVDDEEIVRSVAERILTHHGYKILVAGDGKEALEVFEDHKEEVSLVLLDLTMPRMSGREALVAIRERYGDVPVVVCSGYLVDLEGFEDETGYRPDAAVQKPYNVKDLAAKVREVIDAEVLAS